MAIPGEDDEVAVWSSTQHPSEIQHIVGHVLNIPSNAVTVNVRRMGGGFGGKETQGNQFAALAAIAAKKLKRSIKLRPDRDEDMAAIANATTSWSITKSASTRKGCIHAVDATYAARCGFSSDLAGPGHRPRAVSCRLSSYFYPHAPDLEAAQDPHRLQHRLSRLRRTAGHAGGRAFHRGNRPMPSARTRLISEN